MVAEYVNVIFNLAIRFYYKLNLHIYFASQAEEI